VADGQALREHGLTYCNPPKEVLLVQWRREARRASLLTVKHRSFGVGRGMGALLRHSQGCVEPHLAPEILTFLYQILESLTPALGASSKDALPMLCTLSSGIFC
jgi:hypothetical protein